MFEQPKSRTTSQAGQAKQKAETPRRGGQTTTWWTYTPGVWISSGSSSPGATRCSTSVFVRRPHIAASGLKLRENRRRFPRIPQLATTNCLQIPTGAHRVGVHRQGHVFAPLNAAIACISHEDR